MTILSFWWIRKQRGPHGNNVKINLQLKQEKSQETSLCPKKIKRFNPATETGRGYIFQQATQSHILMILSASYKYKPVIPPTYLSTYVHTSGVLHKCEKRLSPLPICAFFFFFNWKMGILLHLRSVHRPRHNLCGALSRSTESWHGGIGGASEVRCPGGHTASAPSFLIWGHPSPCRSFSVILIIFLDTKSCFSRHSFFATSTSVLNYTECQF